MFGDKKFTGVGYPTPVSFPSETTCLTVQVPASDEWWALITGLLYELTLEWKWQQFEGGMDRDVAAGHWSDMLNAALEMAATNNECNSIVPAPFWDDTSGDDAPDEAPADDQRWYGRWDGETFLETVSYTFLTGFIATLVGSQAAIKFLTIPRAFRVLIRQNPHGANLLLFLDGGLYKVINGYSPFDQVAEFLIASPGTELMLVVDSTHDPSSTPNADGNYVVDVIRARLSESDVTNPNVRYYGTPPAFQTTYDDGTTWTDTPSADVRHASYAQFPPLTPYTGIQCDVAARMAAQLKASIDLMCSVADAAQAVTGLLELILLPSGLVGALLSLFFTICDWIIDNGQETILAAFTTTVYDDIKCTLQCYIASDGTITQDNLDAAWEKVKADHPGTVATVVDEVRFLFTDVIFTNAGIKRTETGDCSGCSSCEWLYRWDLTGTDGGWVEDFGNFSAWSSGGWPQGYAGAVLGDNAYRAAAAYFFTMPSACEILQITMTWTGSDADTGWQTLVAVTDNITGNEREGSQFQTTPATSPYIGNFAFTTAGDARLAFCKDRASGGGEVVTQIDVKGAGTKPAFTGGTWIY